MDIDEIKWDSSEKKIARTAFDMAYKNEIEEIKNKIKEKTGKIENVSDVWSLCPVVERRQMRSMIIAILNCFLFSQL